MLIITLFACTSVTDTYSEHYESRSIRNLIADVEDGNLNYQARPGDIDVRWTSKGWGRDEEIANRRQAGNSWEVTGTDNVLNIFSSSDSGGRVDFEVEGPSQMFTDLRLDDGSAHLDGLSGYQSVIADSIWIEGGSGGAELISSGSVNADLHPNPGDTIIIEGSDVTLDLPPGRYDLAVWADPESLLEIDDFGFHHTAFGEGSFAAVSGDGAVRVDVFATGNVTIRETW